MTRAKRLRRWRYRRDAVICLARLHGASLRYLADVFDMSPSAIHRIVKSFREQCGKEVVS